MSLLFKMSLSLSHQNHHLKELVHYIQADKHRGVRGSLKIQSDRIKILEIYTGKTLVYTRHDTGHDRGHDRSQVIYLHMEDLSI